MAGSESDRAASLGRLELHVRDQVFPLTLMEANVLRYLIENEGKRVSRKAMLANVWGLHEDTDTRATCRRYAAWAIVSSRCPRHEIRSTHPFAPD